VIFRIYSAVAAIMVVLLLGSLLGAEAQPAGPVRTVGSIAHTSSLPFEERLRELGWVEGKNVRFERRTSTDNNKLAQFAIELSRIPVDVIFAGNAASTRAAMEATQTIPIITVSADPVSTGFVASLARPGANVTGLAIMHTEVSAKRLEILTQVLPTARRVAFLVNPTNPSTPAIRRETEARARAMGVTLVPFEVSAAERVEKVMAAVAKARPDALVVQGDPLFHVTRQQLLEAAARHRLPVMWESRLWVEAGGLMSYGTDVGELWRRAATYVDRVLRGTKPADLPVEQATRFELAINLKTAKALGLTIPPSVLVRADKVIE
jgi:putative ABC transport system substrate-binding protein